MIVALRLEGHRHLAVLRQAYDRGLLDFRIALTRLLETNFKASDALLKQFAGIL